MFFRFKFSHTRHLPEKICLHFLDKYARIRVEFLSNYMQNVFLFVFAKLMDKYF